MHFPGEEAKNLMKQFLNSNFLTVFLFLVGLLIFAIIFPSLWSANGDNVYTTLGAVYGLFISFILAISHFFWMREKQSGLKKVILVTSKSLGIYVVVTIVFLIYQYQFGSIYGGKKSQRNVYLAEAKITLTEYFHEQDEQFKQTNKFRLYLHHNERYKSKNFKYGTADEDSVIKKYCSDCMVTSQAFKLGAYSIHDEGLVFVIIKNSSNLSGKINFEIKMVPLFSK